MSYVAGFVVPVKTADRETYRRYAAEAASLFREYGATRIVECWGDNVPDGKVTDFRRSVQAEADETVVFSWIEYPSKQVHDDSFKKMMEDPRMEAFGKRMPFDGKRMIFGGFETIVDA
jgi:uncharacterized protein YbaA (DUF1428 family)